jgi:3-dehydroquinate synthase
MKKIDSIKVRLPYITQKIFIGCDIFDFAWRKIIAMHYDKLIAVVDSNLYKLIKGNLERCSENKIADIVVISPTIKYKEFNACSEIIQKMVQVKMNRNCCLIAIGGGYVGDITGFVAANYMRGIDFIQIPTTVMSMSDTIIGKVAINFDGIKNLLGSFCSPRYTFCDINLLKTLNEKEIIFGLVEVWKHALLVNDNSIARKITNYLDKKSYPNIFFELTKFSLKTKKKFVENDFYDKNGMHKALSLGHTFANYLEQKFNLRHGSAVFYGIILEIILSLHFKTINQDKFNSIKPLIKKFEEKIGMLHNIQTLINIEETINNLKFDKINQGNHFTFVLLTKNGFCVKSNVTSDNLRTALIEFSKFNIE